MDRRKKIISTEHDPDSEGKWFEWISEFDAKNNGRKINPREQLYEVYSNECRDVNKDNIKITNMREKKAPQALANDTKKYIDKERERKRK